MTDISYDDAPVPIRADLIAAHQRSWARLAGPGTWFDGKTRIAIAAERARIALGASGGRLQSITRRE